MQEIVRKTPSNGTFTFDYKNTLQFMTSVFCSFEMPGYKDETIRLNINQSKMLLADIYNNDVKEIT